MKIKTRYINIFFFAVLILAGLALVYQTFFVSEKKLSVNGVDFKIEIANTTEKRTRGLGFRDSLEPQTGMLFEFDTYEVQHFCMCNMRFPLDFVWIKDNTIVGITQDVPDASRANGEVVFINSPADVNRVLEINAGEIKKYNIKVGDTIRIRN